MSVVALAGGVGGAKLAAGLASRLGSELTIIANTGDDFAHLGLHISPDLDTLMYTLAGIANPATGWGIAGETWAFLEQLGKLGGPTWFRLGDKDLATHVARTQRLDAGDRLTTITSDLCGRLGITCRILPMCDEPVGTVVHTDAGSLPFQDYFVRLQCAPRVTGFTFAGSETARPTQEIRQALADPALTAILLGPSNPFISIDPILAVPGMRDLILGARVPVVAVSPIVAGAAIKGPAAKMMAELGLTVTAASVAAHYRGLITGFMIDATDAGLAPAIKAMGMSVISAATVMHNAADRRRLASECLAFAETLR